MVVRWEKLAVYSCYFSFNRSRRDLEESLDSLRDSARRVGGKVHLVFRDFNAWFTQWGSPTTNAKDKMVES